MSNYWIKKTSTIHYKVSTLPVAAHTETYMPKTNSARSCVIYSSTYIFFTVFFPDVGKNLDLGTKNANFDFGGGGGGILQLQIWT